MLATIENHTHHHTFRHGDIANGGLVAAGLTHGQDEVETHEASKLSTTITIAFGLKRKEFDVRSADTLRSIMSEDRYHQMLSQYNAERWIDLDFMAEIRDSIPQRYLVFARVEDTSQSRTSNCSRRKKKKKKDKDGNETDEDEEGPDFYNLWREVTRTAVISADVFDLAQDIIVWSGTREEQTSDSYSYETTSYVTAYDFLEIYPYPDYPSWHKTYINSIKSLVLHMPHKSD